MAAGFNHTVPLGALTIGTLMGRYARFMTFGALLFFFGPPVKGFVDRHFKTISLLIAALFIAGLVLTRYFG
jgi:hypothetical protein